MTAAAHFTVAGNVVDIAGRKSYPARVTVAHGRIDAISPISSTLDTYLLPGFIDAHVHIESSMLVPSEFARTAVVHGTVATVSDPHEIGNVLGVAGIEFGCASVSSPGLEQALSAETAALFAPLAVTLVDGLQQADLAHRGYLHLHITADRVEGTHRFVSTIDSRDYTVVESAFLASGANRDDLLLG